MTFWTPSACDQCAENLVRTTGKRCNAWPDFTAEAAHRTACRGWQCTLRESPTTWMHTFCWYDICFTVSVCLQHCLFKKTAAASVHLIKPTSHRTCSLSCEHALGCWKDQQLQQATGWYGKSSETSQTDIVCVVNRNSCLLTSVSQHELWQLHIHHIPRYFKSAKIVCIDLNEIGHSMNK